MFPQEDRKVKRIPVAFIPTTILAVGILAVIFFIMFDARNKR